MARWPAPVLLGLLALAQLDAGDAACGYRKFTCANGDCIDARSKCDGRNNCADGSDEVAAMCDGAPSVRVRLGEVQPVRVQHKKEHGDVLFDLCDATSCSRLHVAGSTADGSLAHSAWTECNARGGGCGQLGLGARGWEFFLDGPLDFVAERRPGELAVWLRGHEDKATTVPVKEGSDLLRVRPNYWSIDMPVEFSRVGWQPALVRIEVTEPECRNGGTIVEGSCFCKPGFSGVLCDKACGPDKFGDHCERSCSEELTSASKGCSGVRFSATGSVGSSCAAGFQGPGCDQVCDGTRFGAGCSEPCGKCGGAGHCDPYTGECLAGCLPGYHGASCNNEFSYLMAAPNVTKVTSHSVEGSVQLQGNTAGSGSVKYVQLQHREVGRGDWVTGALAELGDPSDSIPFALDGLRADAAVELRAILLDERMSGRPAAAQARVRTEKGVLWNVAAAEGAQGEVQVSWQQSGWSRPVVVEYECESVAGCAERCGHSSGAVQVAAGGAARLQGLLPAARYRLTVRAGRQAESLAVHTAVRAPNATVSSLETALATNASSFVKWAGPDSCLGAGAPWHHYRWQLIRSNGEVQASGASAVPALLLEDLEPGKKYGLQVAVANAAGASPWRTANFTTLHSAPSAPRELTAYRWNSTSLSLAWRAPALPGGEMRKYAVSVEGLPEELVAADSPCAAWPDMVCHVARRPLGKAPPSALSVAVAGVNDKTERRGDEARIAVAPRDSRPDAVLGLEALPSADAVELRWRLPRLLRGDLRQFAVDVARVLQGSGSAQVEPDPDVAPLSTKEERRRYELAVGGLLANATYRATVRCGATGGASDDASVLFTTDAGTKAPQDNGLQGQQ